MPTATISLLTDTGLLPGIQIWSDVEITQPITEASLSLICLVNHQKIPLFLVSCGPFDVYTENQNAETFFYDKLAYLDHEIGILTKIQTEDFDCYVVFYLEHLLLPRVRCFYVDFSILQQVEEIREFADSNYNEDVFFASKNRINPTKSDTSVFDRVLEHKTGKLTPNISAPQPQVASSLGLTSSHQISQAVNRVVLSGLRIRGLSANTTQSANDKIAIREIYHMTKQATLFALRKYGYEFNEKSSSGKEVHLHDIQDIVESLLLIFVDVETATFNKTRSP